MFDCRIFEQEGGVLICLRITSYSASEAWNLHKPGSIKGMISSVMHHLALDHSVLSHDPPLFRTLTRKMYHSLPWTEGHYDAPCARGATPCSLPGTVASSHAFATPKAVPICPLSKAYGDSDTTVYSCLMFTMAGIYCLCDVRYCGKSCACSCTSSFHAQL